MSHKLRSQEISNLNVISDKEIDLKFFNSDDLQLALDRKVNISQLDKMNDVKCNKTDLYYAIFVIENLNERLKHLSIV